MKPGVTCQKLVSINKISPIIEKTHLFIIYIFKLNSLMLCFFSYPAYVDTGALDCV